MPHTAKEYKNLSNRASVSILLPNGISSANVMFRSDYYFLSILFLTNQ